MPVGEFCYIQFAEHIFSKREIDRSIDPPDLVGEVEMTRSALAELR